MSTIEKTRMWLTDELTNTLRQPHAQTQKCPRHVIPFISFTQARRLPMPAHVEHLYHYTRLTHIQCKCYPWPLSSYIICGQPHLACHLSREHLLDAADITQSSTTLPLLHSGSSCCYQPKHRRIHKAATIYGGTYHTASLLHPASLTAYIWITPPQGPSTFI